MLELGKVCLEAIVFLGGGLFQLVEFVSGCFFEVIGIEHVFKGLLYGFPVFVCGWSDASASFFSQTPVKYFPRPWFILFSMVTDLVLSELKVDGLIEKYASIASIHRMASSDSPEKCSGRAALISAVLVVVDMGFAGGGLTGGFGLTGGCDGGTVVGKIDEVVVGTAEDTVVTRGVTGGSGLVTGLLG